MNYKRNFIKREAVKENYRGMKWGNVTDENTNNKDKKVLRKDEPFVLMFRDFLFFDVKSYECRYGDLYIRNVVDGVILKRYFRMNANDQLTVFKNRSEFDEFIDKVKEEGYMFGPEAIKKVPVFDTDTGDIVSITSTWDGESFTYEDEPSFFDMVTKVFEKEHIKLQHHAGNGMKLGNNKESLGRTGGTL